MLSTILIEFGLVIGLDEGIDTGEILLRERVHPNKDDTLSTIQWEGRTINIPNYVEEYLSLRYGNWQVPERNYNAGLHDGSIAEKGF